MRLNNMDEFVKNLIDPRTGKRLIEVMPDAFAVDEDNLPPPPEGLEREAPQNTPLEIVVSKEERNARYDICKACDKLRGMSKTCRICNCLMPAKTWLKPSNCPQGKW